MSRLGMRTRSSHNIARGSEDLSNMRVNTAQMSHDVLDIADASLLYSATSYDSMIDVGRPQSDLDQQTELSRQPSQRGNNDSQNEEASTSAAMVSPTASATKKRKSRSKVGSKDKKTNICPYEDCRRAFTNSGHLARHIRSHTGEKRFLCTFPDCGSRFSRHDNMLQHYRNHIQRNWRRRSKANARADTDAESEEPSPKRSPVKGKGKARQKLLGSIDTSASGSASLPQEPPSTPFSTEVSPAESPRAAAQSSMPWYRAEGSDGLATSSPRRSVSGVLQYGPGYSNPRLSLSNLHPAPLQPWAEGPLPSPSILERPMSATGYSFYPNDVPAFEYTTGRRPSLSHRHSYHALSTATGGEIDTPIIEHGDPFALDPRSSQTIDPSAMAVHQQTWISAPVNAYRHLPPIQARGAVFPQIFGNRQQLQHESLLSYPEWDQPMSPTYVPTPYDLKSQGMHDNQMEASNLPLLSPALDPPHLYHSPRASFAYQPQEYQPALLYSPPIMTGLVASEMPAFFRGPPSTMSSSLPVPDFQFPSPRSVRVPLGELGPLPSANLENLPFPSPPLVSFAPTQPPQPYEWTASPVHSQATSPSMMPPADNLLDLYHDRPFAEAAAEWHVHTNSQQQP